jgi:hypothetical protein
LTITSIHISETQTANRGGGNKLPKAKTKRHKDTPEKQHARFVEAAKQAEADESPAALDKAFKKLDTRAVKKVASSK